MADKIAKRRHAYGSRSGTAKLSEAHVKEILIKKSNLISELAKKYGVDRETIRPIIDGTAWRHVQ
jgi:hypothetical protein